MKNTTVFVSDEEFERLVKLQEEVLARITGFSASDRLSRDEVHERGVR